MDFDEFLSAIKTIMLFDNYFEEMESLFRYLDQKKTGKVPVDALLSSSAKLRAHIDKFNSSPDAANQKCELRIPSQEELESGLRTVSTQEDGQLDFNEYLVLLFKITVQDGFD